MFDYTREHENDFSFWYPKIKDCGIPTPLTFYTKLPSAEEEPEYVKRLYEAFYMEHPKEDEEVVKAYLEERVIPKLKEMGLTGHVFVKNGRFSNKFNANGTCNLYGLHELYRAIILINYEAICCGAEGADEIVVRKFIESPVGMTPCIYNGLPLRPEFRVFYDFDTREPIFTANYWDYDYVYPHLYHATDKIIFEHERERLEGVYAHFKDAVQDKVADAMRDVQGLTGQWSVDVLMDEREKFWLIDRRLRSVLRIGRNDRRGMRNEVSTGLQMPAVRSAVVQITASGGAAGNAPGPARQSDSASAARGEPVYAK